MAERKASAFVCDEALFSLSGKITISGMYTQDIVISSNEQQITQLVFLFTVETPKSEPFKSLTMKVVFPGSDPIEAPALTAINPPASTDPRRKQITYRLPLLIPQPVLRPGRIVASVVHEDGEMEAAGFWVVTMEEAQKTVAAAMIAAAKAK
jgi:hypothetical protein